jgi:KDEL-tailed cysteine endopeptidase
MKLGFIILLISTVFMNIRSLAPEKANIVTTLLESQMDKSPKELFKIWHLLYQKEYTFDSDEAKKKFKIFKENLARIKETNAKNLPYKVGLNQFSDLSNEEFRMRYANLRPSEKSLDDEYNQMKKDNFFLNEDDDDDLTKRNLQSYLPIDYSKWYGYARDQGSCGSCWAYTTSAAIEGGTSKKLNRVIPYLSNQQQVDCSTNNSGCQGGSLRQGMNYALSYGLEYDSDYPYIGYQGTCKYSSTKFLTRITSWDYCANYSAYTTRYCTFDKVYNFLKVGPLSTSTDGGTWDFQNYSSGILTASCSQVNHAVTLVGYGVSTTGIKYWLIRNSWGSYWGENGYIRIQVNPSNKNSCFIEYEVVLPKL